MKTQPHISNPLMSPSGAYVSLEALQQLRYLAKQCGSVSFGKSAAMLGGHHKSRAISRGMEFEDVRPYQAGDDIRSIDWRVTARTQVTHSKRYSEEKEKPIITAVDQRRSLFFGSNPCFKSVYACHLAALINWATLHAGDRSGGFVLGSQGIQETRAVRSHKNVNRWLQQLSEANQQLKANVPLTKPEIPFSEFLEQLIHRTPTGTQIFIISDFYDFTPECEKRLFQLARHHHVALLWVVDQLEEALPSANKIQISDGKIHTPFWIKKRANQAFAEQFATKQEHLTEVTQKLGLRLYKASVQTPPIDIIQGMMPS